MTMEPRSKITGTPPPPKAPASAPEPAAKRLEAALRGLIKLLSAIRFYPPGHPSLQETTRDTLQTTMPLLAGAAAVTFTIRKDHFLLGEEKVGSDNPQLAKFATYLFMRRIQQLSILPDLSLRDLWHFAEILTLDPAEIHKRGGVPDLLNKLQIAAIAANEVDLEKVLARKAAIEETLATPPPEIPATAETAMEATLATAADPLPPLPPSPATPATPQQQLEQLLRQLRQAPSDTDFCQLVLQVPPLIRPNLTEAGRFLALQALVMLGSWSTDRRLPPARATGAGRALAQLSGDEILDFVISLLCTRGIAEDQREQVQGLLTIFGRSMATRLMARLASDEDSWARKMLSDGLARQGTAVLDVLIEHLKDQRWFVVRNSIAILGEIRDPAAVPALKQTFSHPDNRVRRETVRTLTRIGGPIAVEVLQQALYETDLDLRRQAIISLGAIKHLAAVPALLKIVAASDPFAKQLDMKRLAIKALAEIGAVDAVLPLANILSRRKVFFRNRFDELRATAAAALGEIGHPAAAEILEWATEDRAPAVARAATGALKQLIAKGPAK